jgi:hypothetical protein
MKFMLISLRKIFHLPPIWYKIYEIRHKIHGWCAHKASAHMFRIEIA